MNIYVSNLGVHFSDTDLRKLFNPFGKVYFAQVVTDKISGRSRGFGFVEMALASEAAMAMYRLHGKEVNGKRITVSEAKEG